MPSEFDPDSGVLRLSHGTLSVLARLAVAPTDPSLHDHDVAPHIAELRTLGILSSRGMDPTVAPLAAAVGSAERTFQLEVDDHGDLRRFRGWVGPELAVVGVQLPGTDEHELMADVPAMLPSLITELVGLGVAPEPRVAGDRTLPAVAMAQLAQRGPAATVEDAQAVLGPDGSREGWPEALADAVRAATLRWRLVVGDTWLEVVDAGRSGLWTLEPADDPDELDEEEELAGGWLVRIAPITTPAVQERLRELL